MWPQVYQLFSSADSLHAAFWPRPRCATSTSSSSSSTSSGGDGAAANDRGQAAEAAAAGAQDPPSSSNDNSRTSNSTHPLQNSGSNPQASSSTGAYDTAGPDSSAGTGDGWCDSCRGGAVVLGPAAAAVARGLDWGAARAMYGAIAATRSQRVSAALTAATEKLLLFMGVGGGPGLNNAFLSCASVVVVHEMFSTKVHGGGLGHLPLPDPHQHCASPVETYHLRACLTRSASTAACALPNVSPPPALHAIGHLQLRCTAPLQPAS